MSQIRRIARMLVTLVAVAALFGMYRLVVVPWIEPPLLARSLGPAGLGGNQAVDVVERQREQLAFWFAESDWERRTSKILESPRGMLLLDRYENVGEGRVLLMPCTMILYPEGQVADESERRRRALILRAPEGAELQFDDGFDLRLAKFGRLRGGRLIGPITIHSDQKQPGPHDDLHVVARDAVLDGDRITTPHPVEFRLGPNHGTGRDLLIELYSNPQAPAHQTLTVSGLRALELRQDVRMRLVMAGTGLLPSAAPAAGQTSGPVEVTCRGPLRFDLEKYVCTFRDAVDVIRPNPKGGADQLWCELLALHLAPQGGPAAAGSRKIPRLEPDWLEAQGRPVRVTSPTTGAEARGQILKYNLRSREVTLADEMEAVVVRGTDELRAKKLAYVPSPEHAWGTFVCTGAGTIRGLVPQKDRPGAQPFLARWERGVRFARHEGQHVLSVEGAAHVFAEELGGIDADSLHVWFTELAAGTVTAAPALPAGVVGTSALAGGTPRTRLAPERLLAEGNVRIAASSLTGEVGQLRAWIVRPDSAIEANELPPPGPAQAGASPGPELTNGAPVVEQPPGSAPPSRRFHIQARVLQAQLRATAAGTTLTRADAEGNVVITETEVALPDDQPLVVRGSAVEIEDATPGAEVMRITGQPGHVSGRGLSLDGPVIRLDRGQNLLAVDGQGKLVLPVDENTLATATGGPAVGGLPPPPAVAAPPFAAAGASQAALEVRWMRRLDFDGQVARFAHQVHATLGEQTVATEQMEVRLAQAIDFAAAAPSAKPQVETIACRHGVLLDRLTHDAGGKLSDERIEIEGDLLVNQLTGALTADGPGRIDSVRRAAPRTGLVPPALAGQVKAPDAPAGPLDYLGIRFSRGVVGNLRLGELTLRGDVKSIFGPVAHWEARLDLDADPAQLGKQVVRLEADELHLARIAEPGAAPSNELTALGSALVEGADFTALAQRVAYVEAKQTLTLEGDQRVDAKLQRQQVVGGEVQSISARKLTYWMATGNWRIDDFRGGDFSPR